MGIRDKEARSQVVLRGKEQIADTFGTFDLLIRGLGVLQEKIVSPSRWWILRNSSLVEGVHAVVYIFFCLLPPSCAALAPASGYTVSESMACRVHFQNHLCGNLSPTFNCRKAAQRNAIGAMQSSASMLVHKHEA